MGEGGAETLKIIVLTTPFKVCRSYFQSVLYCTTIMSFAMLHGYYRRECKSVTPIHDVEPRVLWLKFYK